MIRTILDMFVSAFLLEMPDIGLNSQRLNQTDSHNFVHLRRSDVVVVVAVQTTKKSSTGYCNVSKILILKWNK